MGKGARRSAPMANARKAKDQARAAAMRGVVRTMARCPICHKVVPLAKIPVGHDCK